MPRRWPEIRYLAGCAVTLFSDPAPMDAAITFLRNEGYEVAEIDAATDLRLLEGLDRALHWSENFGYVPQDRHLSALHDVIPHRASDRLLIVFHHFDLLLARDAGRGRYILDTFSYESRQWLLADRRLAIFAHVPGRRPDLRYLGGGLPRWDGGAPPPSRTGDQSA